MITDFTAIIGVSLTIMSLIFCIGSYFMVIKNTEKQSEENSKVLINIRISQSKVEENIKYIYKQVESIAHDFNQQKANVTTLNELYNNLSQRIAYMEKKSQYA